MSRSENLRKAKQNKADEFYTQLTDIEKELSHYKDEFENKIVFCNCDDPFESNFFKYFALNFNFLKLKRLICTCYDDSPIAGEQLSLFDLSYEVKSSGPNHAYKIIINSVPDINKDGATDMADVETLIKTKENTLTLLKGDGDFRSPECIKLLKEADIVVTNPPFSLFREYIAQLMEYKKKFLIIGNINAVNNKDFFPLIKDNKVWIGYKFNGSPMMFRIPKRYEVSGTVTKTDEEGNQLVGVGGTCWFTNLDVQKRHERMILYKKYNSIEYPNYFNYDGIDVKNTNEIPSDYNGIMGVPISFLDKYNPEQFRIIGNGSTIEKKYIHTVTENKKTIQYIDKETNEVKWTFPYTVNERKIGNGLRIERDGKPAESPYSRLMIQIIEEDESDENSIEEN